MRRFLGGNSCWVWGRGRILAGCVCEGGGSYGIIWGHPCMVSTVQHLLLLLLLLHLLLLLPHELLLLLLPRSCS